MTRHAPRSVLVYATGPLGERLAGPEIRALQFAKALRSHFEITMMAQRPDACERDGLRVVPSTRAGLLREAARHDAIISPCLPPYVHVLKNRLGLTTISDKYDPHDVELVALENEQHDRELHLRSLSLAIDLRCADFVLCAAERQREPLIAAARSFEKPGLTLSVDPIVVPFGIPDPPLRSGRTPLHARFPQIGDRDKIVLWWGAVWKWLDVETVIRAIATIAKSRQDIKLIITAGAPPNRNNSRFDAVADARQLAENLGVIERSVLFLDEWIPYEQRYDYLREADLGVTLHRYTEEAELAARSRYVDYLAASLPCVLGRGDEMATDFEAAGFASLIDHRDPDRLAKQIVELLDDPRRLRAAAAAGDRLATERSWTAVGESLRAIVASEPRRRPASARSRLAVLGGSGSYYAHKLADRLATSLG